MKESVLALFVGATVASLIIFLTRELCVSASISQQLTTHNTLHDCGACTVVEDALARDLGEWPAITATTANATIATVQPSIVASLVRVVSDGSNFSMFVDPPRSAEGKPELFYTGMEDTLHGIHEAVAMLARRGEAFDVWFGLNVGDFCMVNRNGDAKAPCDTNVEGSASLRSSSKPAGGIDETTPLVFGTNRDCGRGAQVLAPNMEFYARGDFIFGSRFAQAMNATESVQWSSRNPVPFWRGGANCRRYGQYVDDEEERKKPEVADCIRLDLHKWCKDRQWVERRLADVGYVRDHRSCENDQTVGLSCTDYPPKEPSDVWSWTGKAVAFHPSGHTYSSRLYKVMAVGAAILLDDDPNDEFFYTALRPGVHFIPFGRSTIEPLLEAVHNASANPGRSFTVQGLPYRGHSLDIPVSAASLELMGSRNAAFVREQLNPGCLRCYWMRAVQRLAEAQAANPSADGATFARWAPRPLLPVEEACVWARSPTAEPLSFPQRLMRLPCHTDSSIVAMAVTAAVAAAVAAWRLQSVYCQRDGQRECWPRRYGRIRDTLP